ncbi:hypothetical protein PROFUN_08603 [Planoprotostelium fungivorum]|uniref:Uncharacterized protein n=1 Tax=Planoprotostelium fungivorum TaxID=1890364 RepID=A0A2P6NJ74_9EUKA|nr:hypothetical protein PROFUN_08603 [Planoprotostelium fungivorum]
MIHLTRWYSSVLPLQWRGIVLYIRNPLYTAVTVQKNPLLLSIPYRPPVFMATRSLRDLSLSFRIAPAPKAMMIVRFSKEGQPFVSLVDDMAKSILSPLLDNSGSGRNEDVRSFWKTIETVGRGETEREEVKFQVSGSPLSVKFRQTRANGETTVIVTARKTKRAQSQMIPSSNRSGIPMELNGLINAIEQDVIGKILGIDQMFLGLFEAVRGRYSIFAVSPSFAHLLHYSQPHELRGMNTTDLSCPTAESGIIFDQISSNMNPDTKTATLSTSLHHFPGIFFFFAIREITPGVNLSLFIAHDHNRHSMGPPPPAVPALPGNPVWRRSEWDEVLENCLHYIHFNRHHASHSKMTLPKEFLEDSKRVYCYVYTGERGFLPSGNSDGYIWRSSCGIVSGGSMKKKYHYVDLPDGKKLRRRVMWLEQVKDLYIVEYRHHDNNYTAADLLLGPDCMDWDRLLHRVHAANQHLNNSLASIQSGHFNRAETRVNQSEIGSENVVSYVNDILTNWATEYGRQ